jgi:hypothetical protein
MVGIIPSPKLDPAPNYFRLARSPLEKLQPNPVREKSSSSPPVLDAK